MAEISTDNVEFSQEEAKAYDESVADGTNEEVIPDESAAPEVTEGEDASLAENAFAGQVNLPVGTYNGAIVRLQSIANGGDCASQQPIGTRPPVLPVWTWRYGQNLPSSHKFKMQYANGAWYLVNQFTRGYLYMRNQGQSAVTIPNWNEWCAFLVHSDDNGQSFIFTSKKNQKLNLDVRGGAPTHGQDKIPIQAYPANNSTAQKWKVIKTP